MGERIGTAACSPVGKSWASMDPLPVSTPEPILLPRALTLKRQRPSDEGGVVDTAPGPRAVESPGLRRRDWLWSQGPSLGSTIEWA